MWKECFNCGLKFQEDFIKDEILIALCKARHLDFCSMECYDNYEAEHIKFLDNEGVNDE